MRTEKQRKAAREYCARNRELRRRLNREWIRNNRERYNAAKARYRIKLKREAMELYCLPVACQRCGFAELDALCLDHIAENGAAHRRALGCGGRGNPTGTTIYERIRALGKLPGLQVLCANCNIAKHLRHRRALTIKDPALLAEIERYARGDDSRVSVATAPLPAQIMELS